MRRGQWPPGNGDVPVLEPGVDGDIGDDLNDHEEGDEEASGSSSFDNECDALAKLSLGVPRQAGPSEDDVATTARDTSPGPLAQVAHAAADPESPCNPSAGYTKPGSLLWGGIHRQMQPSRLMVNPSTAAGKSSSAAPLAPGQPSVAGLQQPRQSILPSAVAGAVGSPAAAAALDSTSSAAVAASATAAQQVLSRLSSFVSSSWSPSQLLPQDLLGSLGAEPGVTGAAAYPAPHLQDVTQARTDHSQQTAPEETAGCSNEPDAPADTAGSCSSQGDAAAAGSGPSAAAAPSNAAGGAWNMAIPVVRGALQPTCVPGAPIWDGHIWHPAAAVQPLQAAAVPGADGLRHVPLHNAAAAAHRVGGSTRRLFGFGAAGALVAADTSGSVGAGKAGVYKLALAQAALPVVAGWPVGTLGFAAAAAIQPPVVQGPGALPYQHLQEARAAAAAASGLAWHAQQPDVFYGCGTHLVHELSEPMTSHGMVVGVGQELDRGACGRVCLATTPDGSIFPGIVVKVCHGLNGCFNDADSYNELFHLEKLHGQEGIVPVFGAGWLVPSSNCSPEVLAVLRTRPVWCVLLERMQAPLSAVIHRAGGFRILLALRVTRTVLGILKRLHEDLERAYAHRDIKPHNVLINSRGQLFLADLGTMASYPHGSFKKFTTFTGTIEYMAKELLDVRDVQLGHAQGLAGLVGLAGQHQQYDVTDDVHAVLMMLLDMLAGLSCVPNKLLVRDVRCEVQRGQFLNQQLERLMRGELLPVGNITEANFADYQPVLLRLIPPMAGVAGQARCSAAVVLPVVDELIAYHSRHAAAVL